MNSKKRLFSLAPLLAGLVFLIVACSTGGAPEAISGIAIDPSRQDETVVEEHDAVSQTEVSSNTESVDEPSLDESTDDLSDTAQISGERPAWQVIPLTEVRSGETFTLADFQDNVLIVEAMAVWCPLCDQQQLEIRRALEQLGDSVTAVSLDVDPGETADIAAAHADQFGIFWNVAIAGNELSLLLQNEFGPQILTPPATPVIIIKPDGSFQLTPGGIKSARALIDLVQAAQQ